LHFTTLGAFFLGYPLSPGDRLGVSGTVLGNYLTFSLDIFAPTTGHVDGSGTYFQDPQAETGILDERGIYTIQTRSYGVGLYTLYIGCTLRDGTVIQPGEAPSTSGGGTTSPQQSQQPAFSGVGFPGLAPVDFSQVARLPLPAGMPMGGAVTATGGEIIGYTVNVNAGDKLDLNFTRASGNLNLGLVVLSSDNKVVYMAALVTSETMTTRFVVPAAGEYTIGIFRLDLLPPPDPQPTAFQIQVAVNAP
jgi:hypothetical protein